MINTEAFRCAADISKMIDEYMAGLRRANPGVAITRSDALRNLVVFGADAVKAKEKDHGEGQD